MNRLLFAALAMLCAAPALADTAPPDPQAEHIATAPTHRLNATEAWFVKAQGGGAFGYDATSLSTDAQGYKQITAGLYMKAPMEIRGRQVSFILEDATLDCTGSKFAVSNYYLYDAGFTLMDTAPDNGWQNVTEDPMLGDLLPSACERKLLDGATSAGDRDAALRMMKTIGG